MSGAVGGKLRRAGRWVGPLSAASVFLVLEARGLLGLEGRVVAAVAAWMAVWWLTEAIPLAATALLPIVVLPFGGRSVSDVTAPYAHKFIFLFLGGFLVALSMERWGLHRRIALGVLRVVGARATAIVGGFMAVTAFLSMWMSNTATAVMMLPIAVSVIDLVAEKQDESGPSETGALPTKSRNFALCLLLGVAYGASIGGVGTLVGTPPNLFLASFLREKHGHEIGFAQWMTFGLPLVAVMLPLSWWLLTRWLYPIRVRTIPGGRELLRREWEALGPANGGERVTAGVFALMALLWMARPLLQRIHLGGVEPFAALDDTMVAIAAALVLFVLPAGSEGEPTLDWSVAGRLPWGILLLFGGGLSLASALEGSGVTRLLGEQVADLSAIPPPAIVLSVTALVVFLTEVTSNTATAAAFVPILGGVAPALGIDPYLVTVSAAVAASCAFMMPVATPPNAVVFGSGHLTVPDMARAGVWMNFIAIGVVALFTWFFALPLLSAR
jgi:sodium-dependent dicarboxylate transporter 2/3/5